MKRNQKQMYKNVNVSYNFIILELFLENFKIINNNNNNNIVLANMKPLDRIEYNFILRSK